MFALEEQDGNAVNVVVTVYGVVLFAVVVGIEMLVALRSVAGDHK